MHRIRLDVALPRGPEHYWQMMVDLTRKAGGFTITDVWGLTNSRSRNTVKGYIVYCRDAGHIEETGALPNGAITYRVINLTVTAPTIRRPDYQGTRGRVQQAIWSAMRGLPQFTIKELAVEASTDEITITDGLVRDYLIALQEAGYITTLRPSQKLKTRGLFRLKPIMNTGPAAPAIMKARFVYDRNRKCTYGEAEAETGASS